MSKELTITQMMDELLSKYEISSLDEKDFKVTFYKALKLLKSNYDGLYKPAKSVQEYFNDIIMNEV